MAGLGNPEGSQRALNMLFALRTIQERTGKDLGATFLSGTAISNSLTELYLLFKYLCPQELERQNINPFDAWSAVQKCSERE
jgi:N12 class adenine-specific DNA methylase